MVLSKNEHLMLQVEGKYAVFFCRVIDRRKRAANIGIRVRYHTFGHIWGLPYMTSAKFSIFLTLPPLTLSHSRNVCYLGLLFHGTRPPRVRTHTVLFFKIYAVEIGHQFRARGIIRIGQDYISSEYEQVPTRAF